MRKQNIFVVSLLYSMFIGCQQPKFHLVGHITGMDNDKIMLFKFKGDTIFSADSTIIKNHNFTFEGEEFLDDIAILTAGNYPAKVFAAEVVLENGTIMVDMDSVAMVAGTHLNNVYTSYKETCKEYISMLNTLKRDNKIPDLLPIHSEAGTITNRLRDYRKEVILKNIGNPVGSRIFKNLMVNNNLPDSIYQLIISRIPEEFRTDQEIVEIVKKKDSEREKEEKRLFMVGKKFVDFDLITPENRSVKLSNYIGHSKFTLIEFWASWCGPCIAQVPRLKQLYNSYKDMGLSIVGISLDTNKNDWQRGIIQVETPWTQLSDLKGMPSALSEAYGVEKIPRSLLVNQNGIIVNVDLSVTLLEIVLKKALIENEHK